MADDVIYRQNKLILVAEDETPLRNALVSVLQDAGFSVIEASDGESALTKALSLSPDLILLDMVMPKMNGFTVLEKLRADPRGKEMMVVALTILSDPEVIEKLEFLGVKEILNKNEWKLDDMVKRVKKILGLSV